MFNATESNGKLSAIERLERGELLDAADWKNVLSERADRRKAAIQAAEEHEKRIQPQIRRHTELCLREAELKRQREELFTKQELLRREFAENPKAKLADAIATEIEFTVANEKLRNFETAVAELKRAFQMWVLPGIQAERDRINAEVVINGPVSKEQLAVMRVQNSIAYSRLNPNRVDVAALLKAKDEEIYFGR